MFKKLQNASLEARKAKSDDAKILGVFLSDVKMRAKNDGNREPTDEDVVKVANSLLKSINQSIELLNKQNWDASEAQRERTILEEYLPKMLSEIETIKAVGIAFADVEAKDMKDMGKVMTILKQLHGANIDMKLAAQIFKTQVQG